MNYLTRPSIHIKSEKVIIFYNQLRHLKKKVMNIKYQSILLISLNNQNSR